MVVALQIGKCRMCSGDPEGEYLTCFGGKDVGNILTQGGARILRIIRTSHGNIRKGILV